MAMRGGWADPWRPWAPAGAVVISAALFGVVAFRARSSVHEYVSGMLAMLAGFLVASLGLLNTAEGYAAVLLLIAAFGTWSQWMVLRRRQRELPMSE